MSSPALQETGFNSRRSAVEACASGWTEEKIEAVRQGYANGERVRDIAARIGMGRNAVIGKAGRLGLVHPGGQPRGGGVRSINRALRAERKAAREAEREAFAEVWAAGTPVDDIADRFGIAINTVKWRARRMGLPRRAREYRPLGPRNPERLERVRAMWADYRSKGEIAAALGAPRPTVDGIVQSYNLRRNVRVMAALNRWPQLRAFLPDEAAILRERDRLSAAKKEAPRRIRQRREEEKRAVQQAALEAAHETGFFNGKSRNEIICWKRAFLGMTLEEIGKEYGITRERVRQICAKGGVTPARELRERAA